MELPIDIIRNIYDFLPFGKECLVNKNIYYTVTKRIIKEFYEGESDIKNCNCGHKYLTRLFIWKERTRYFDEDLGYYDFINVPRELKLCETCFNIGLLDFYKRSGEVPHLRYHGSAFCNNVFKLREISESELLSTMSSKKYKALNQIIFEHSNTYFTIYYCDYYKREPYAEKCKLIV